jgi:hypothetical protein
MSEDMIEQDDRQDARNMAFVTLDKGSVAANGIAEGTRVWLNRTSFMTKSKRNPFTVHDVSGDTFRIELE